MSGTKIFAMVAALLCAGLPIMAAAQSEESAGIVTTVNGDATLLRAWPPRARSPCRCATRSS